MSDELRERTDELLSSAEASLESLPDRGDETNLTEALTSDDGDNLREAATEASDLLEENDSQAVLEAISLAELPDGSRAETLPEAIARGDAETVSKLRALTKLAKLSDRWDERDKGESGALEDGVTALRETLADRSDALEADISGDEDEKRDGDGESEANAEGGAAEEEGSGDEADDKASADDDLEERLRSAMDGAIGGFGDEVREARDRLQQLRDEREAEAEAASSDVDEATDEDAGAEDAAAEDANAEDEEDEGLVDRATNLADDGGAESGRGETGGRGSTRHSTVPPPPSDRGGMGRVGRFSTIPDRNARPNR